MIIARKLLLPMMIFFSLVLLGLAVVFYINFQSNLSDQEQLELVRFEQVLQTYLAVRGDLASALAVQVSNQAGLAAAFAAQDNAQGAQYCSSALSELQGAVTDTPLDLQRPLPTYLTSGVWLQFHLPPANFWLKCGYWPDAESSKAGVPIGVQQAAWRITLEMAISEQRPTNGIELGPEGLLIRSVLPVIAAGDAGEQGAVLGAVEVSLPFDQALIEGLKENYGGDWSIMLSRQAVETVNIESAAAARGRQVYFTTPTTRGPIEDLYFQASTFGALGETAYGEAHIYRQALLGQAGVSQITRLNDTYAIYTLPLRDFGGQIIGVVDVISNRTAAIAAVRQQLTGVLGLGVAALIIGAIGFTLILRNLLRPVQELTLTAAAIAQGDLNRQIALPTGMADDEIKQLSVSFGAMTRQMRALVGRMEQRVLERTHDVETRSRQLQAAAEIGRDIAARAHQAGGQRAGAAPSLDDLLNLAVRQIAGRFDYYIVSILLTAQGDTAELRAASGVSADRLLQQHLRINLSNPGVVSSVINYNQARIVRDVDQEADYVREALLPETRSEIAVPLRGAAAIQDSTGGRVERAIGVLDVQSRQAAAFDENDVAVLQIIADQLANAIQNLELIDQLGKTIEQLEEASGEFTRQAWQAYLRTLPAAGGEESPAEPQPAAGDVADQKASLHLPLRVREQTIGGIELVFEQEQPPAETVKLVEEVSNRLALVLESTRLLQEARRLALREQIIGQVAARMRASLDVEQVMQNAIQEIAHRMEMTEVEIRLAAEDSADGGLYRTPDSAANLQESL